ncbi:zinc finger protein 585A-like [Anoplophora glabripennis]|uniref:zinc finger protein 585A-like n=1 Tax=Anoplophora glabripennis TaxID=217634 RepID=UPI0008741F9D|nr:zinc finger protein 585A-like [Anoplophora glabripennis]
MDSQQCCIICLDRKKSVQNITLVDETNVKFSEKLRYIAPEVEWLGEYAICERCTNELNNACKFRAQCLSVNVERNNLKHEIIDYTNYSNDAIDDENNDYDTDTTKEESNADTHPIFNKGGDFYVCYDCGEKCTTKKDLINHIKKSHGALRESINSTENELNHEDNEVYRVKEFPCTKCGRRYVLESTLRQHMYDCDGIKRHGKAKSDYQCDKCLKYYSTQKILKAHKKKCEGERKCRKTEFQCTKCNKYYISLKTLKDHYKRGCKKDREDNSNVFFCKICDEYFKSVLILRQHVLSEHKTSEYICDICFVNFNTQEEYEIHNNAKHALGSVKTTKRKGRITSRRFTCEVCNEEFTLLKSVIEHCVNFHSMEEKSIRPYACEKCDNRFRSSTNLINHTLYHDRNRTNICSFCGKSFITKNDLTAHESIHFNRRNYKCNKCEKAFKTNTNLRTHHLIVHTDPSLWKYTCQYCNKRFPQKSNHDQHLRRHIGEKNFICPLCKKPFASKSEMQEHVSYHSNVRAYKCTTCGKEYRKKHTYEVHLAKVHGIGNVKIPVREKKHACHICPSRFYDKLKLARHLCTHSGLKPYPCYACDKKFTDKSYLKHHLKTAHNIIEESKYEWNKLNTTIKMTSSEQKCCVCLNSSLTLNRLSRKDDNDISLLTKLRITMPQIEWLRTYQICEQCTNLLNIVYTFRETCIKSDNIRKQLDTINLLKKEVGYVKTEDRQDSSEENEPDNDVKDEDDDDEEDCNDDNDASCSDDDKDYKVNLKDIKEESSTKRKRKVLVFHCEHCTNSYASSTLLVKHCVEQHGMEGKTVRPFVCTRCNSRFGNSSNLMQHIKYHDAVRCNVCTFCGKGFITKTDLNIHEKQHLNKREYKCETCTKCFNTHKDLRSHKLVVHTDPQFWKYFCGICSKKFPIKSNYDCHMRRHTGDKKFECHLCDKKFTDKCVLQRHMRTHSNVRDFKCSECEKEYKDKRVMQIHMAKVHGIGIGEIKLPSKERKYICHICPKAYFAKNKLTRHLYTHTGEKPFFCTICDKKFNDKSYVKQHMKKTHNIDTGANK